MNTPSNTFRGGHETVFFDGKPALRNVVKRLPGLIALMAILFASQYVLQNFGPLAANFGLPARLIRAIRSNVDLASAARLLEEYLWPAVIGISVLVLTASIIKLKSTRYRVTSHRIDFERGAISKSIDTLELWHVDDVKFRQSPLDRLLGVGTITVISPDKTIPSLSMSGLIQARPLFETLKQQVISVKQERGVLKIS